MMNPTPALSATFVLAAALALTAACNRSPNVMEGTETRSGGMRSYIEISNPGLQRDIALVAASSRRINDILQASCEIESRGRKAHHYEYKFQWIDGDGFPITDATEHWTPDRIEGSERKRLRAMAADPSAETFKLLIRKPDPITRKRPFQR